MNNLDPRNKVNMARADIKRVREAFESSAETLKLLAQHPKLTKGMLKAQFMVIRAECMDALKLADTIPDKIE